MENIKELKKQAEKDHVYCDTNSKRDVTEESIEKKSERAVRHHLENMETLSKREPTATELEEMYGYLDYCWICEKKFSFWDRISFNMVHGFEGNAHRRECHKTPRK